jgi:hypothetical protein
MHEGDFFLLARAAESLQEEVPAAEWRELGNKALKKEKYLFAL